MQIPHELLPGQLRSLVLPRDVMPIYVVSHDDENLNEIFDSADEFIVLPSV